MLGLHRVLRLCLCSIAILGAAAPSGARADGPCAFTLGFKALHDLDPTDVGACVDNQAFEPNGDAQQHTSRGLLAWRKADNWTAFTDGYRTWINGPNGLQSRLNGERFPWEAPNTSPTSPPPATSFTWSGYVVSGGPFVAVEATWVVPVAPTVPGLHGQSTWIGIGGWGPTSALVRAGIAARNGTAPLFPSPFGADQYAFREALPNQSEVTLPLAVRGQDRVHVKLALANERWQITVDNLTSGQSFLDVQVLPAPDSSTAEWILQAPTAMDGTPMPRSVAGQTTFAGAAATTAGGQTVGPAGGQRVQILSGTGVVVNPGPAGVSGFSIGAS